MSRIHSEISKFLAMLLCVLALGYLTYEWVRFFQDIDPDDKTQFLGFISFVGGYCLVLFVLVLIGWGTFLLSVRIDFPAGWSGRIQLLTGYLMLFLAFFLIIRKVFSTGEAFVPENMVLASVALVIVVVSQKLFDAHHQKQLQLIGEKDRQKAELASIKAQVNPHFLFNSLNTLYNDALKIGAADITQNLEKLTDILRYQLHYSAQPVITLEEEVNFISQYVAFQKHRLKADQEVDIRLQIETDTLDYVIHPMILISFVENAFKHGISREHPSMIDILLKNQQGELEMKVRNTNFPKTGKASSGIGLAQVSKLLQLYYPDHRYQTCLEAGYFITELSFNLETKHL